MILGYSNLFPYNKLNKVIFVTKYYLILNLLLSCRDKGKRKNFLGSKDIL